MSTLGLGLVLVSCGSGDGKAPQSPAAPSGFGAAGNESGGIAMASSQGIAPEGFELKMKLDPRPGEDGIIRDGGPVTVEVDLCGSTADAGKTLHFLFDWDFNDLADVSGTGDTCVQKHSFRVPKDATKDVVLEANVCVTNGDPGVHDGSTYFSCRVVRVALPKPSSSSSCTAGAGLSEGCHAFSSVSDTGFVFSVEWPGGTGPYEEVDGFEDTSCGGGSVTGVDVVVTCSLQEAQALCQNEDVDLYGTFPGGQQFYFCFSGAGRQAKVPSSASWRR